MRNRTSLLLFIGLSLPHPIAARGVATSRAVLITHVTVIDVIGGQARPDLTVVIKGDRIDALGKEDKVKVPQAAQVVDEAGKYLIPALWDIHVHLVQPRWRDTYLPLLIVNGVTGVRPVLRAAPLIPVVRRYAQQAGARPVGFEPETSTED